MHPEWRKSFKKFAEDVGARPSGRSVLDRIDNDRSYEPGNVRWTNYAQSNANRSISKFVVVNGKSMCLRHACKELGLIYRPIAKRIQRGWSPERAFSEPLLPQKNAPIRKRLTEQS